MENFVWHNPTRIIFGKGVHKQAGEETAKYTKKVLLHYGGKSIKATGTYDAVVQSLQAAGVEYVELGGVQPNPRLSLVREGIDLCRKENIGFILAVGGGSVIDSSKAIAVGVPYEGDVWDFYKRGKSPEKMLPVGVVLTIPAAGSESSDGSVITDEEHQDKRSCCADFMYPQFALLNPELCYTLPKHQVAAGGADILAHILERYFSPNDHTDLSDRLCEGAMISLMQNLPKVLEDPKDYDAWAEVMWTGNVGHNGLLGRGRKEDWSSHGIEHEISAIYDIAHGAGLAIVFPAWMRYVGQKNPDKLCQFAVRVFGVEAEGKSKKEILEAGIRHLIAFYKSLGLATTLTEAGIGDDKFSIMAEKAVIDGPLGSMVPLEKADVEEILRLAL
ncbi:MAG: iron-containing alcohol dehydrogenase [Lachnospiraceae bacterium]|nr:iron-containing alcohol dehydrogenase [Lachnospiraceae bacterium]